MARVLVLILLLAATNAWAGPEMLFLVAAKTVDASPLIPPNPSFESAILSLLAMTSSDGDTSASAVQTNWTPSTWLSMDGGGGETSASERVAVGGMTGSYALHLLGQGGNYDDGGDGIVTEGAASIAIEFTKASAESGVLAFDIKPLAMGGGSGSDYNTRGFFRLTAYAGSTVISTDCNIKLWDTISYYDDAFYHGNTAFAFTPTIGVKHTISGVDIKALLGSGFTSGKSWADVTTVRLFFIADANGTSATTEFYLDNFH